MSAQDKTKEIPSEIIVSPQGVISRQSILTSGKKGKKKKHTTGDAYNTPYLQPPVLLVVLKNQASQHFILSLSSSNLLV